MSVADELTGKPMDERADESNHEPILVIDSPTAGEPTRVVIAGGPNLGTGTLAERRRRFQETADDFRRTVILEPRGHEAIVGALLCEPIDSRCAAGVIFFNNTGYLGMCGHGAIGVAVTLAYLGRIDIGAHLLETPVGQIRIDLQTPQRVAIDNVDSYRFRTQVRLDVPTLGTLEGDIAWGGNWFFLTHHLPCDLTPRNIPILSAAAAQVRAALRDQNITGADGAEIDHVEFCGPPSSPEAHGRNFVFCPGGAYDRSPCGTGTSAKLACLADEGQLAPGQVWVQESIIGSRFTGTYTPAADGKIVPRIVGEAYVCGETKLIRHAADPFRQGIDLHQP